MDILNTVQAPNENEQTMSSVEIAQVTGKSHGNVLKDIDKLNANYLKMNMSKISLMERPHPTIANRLIRTMRLTKMQTLDLLTGYNIELRIKVNRRWEELELASKNTPKIPQTFSEALMLAAKQAEQLELQNTKIKQDAPKVLFADSVTASTKSILVGELAKILRQNGVNIGQNRLFEWLRENKFLNRKNIPNQRAMDMGLFEMIERTITRPDKDPIINITTKVTGKGQIYFVDKFLSQK